MKSRYKIQGTKDENRGKGNTGASPQGADEKTGEKFNSAYDVKSVMSSLILQEI